MYSGVSGLRAFKSQLDVIGNNIANLNTIGFKSSRVSFQEMMSQTWNAGTGPSSGSGGINPIQVGLGVTVGAIDADTSQGSLQSTGKSTDISVQGGGYLMFGDGKNIVYSRDGAFALDGDYNLVSATSGYKVLGWAPDSTGRLVTSATPSASSGIKIPIGNMSNARQTSIVKMGKNLNADAPNGTTVTPDAYVYDSLGVKHTMNITFERTAVPNQWTFSADCPDAKTHPVTGGVINFDSNGYCISPDQEVSMQLAVDNGSKPDFDFTLSFSDMTQLSDDSGKSSVSEYYQDGLSVGTLESFDVGKDGIVTGVFGNGNKQILGQIAMAVFSNPGGLVRAGSNTLAQGPNSGIPQVAPPDTNGCGALASGFLEASNVDLSNEFANMIIAQRGFQANARTITTSDEIIQELVQLKR
jgi:flagellar hook protein FlgE